MIIQKNISPTLLKVTFWSVAESNATQQWNISQVSFRTLNNSRCIHAVISWGISLFLTVSLSLSLSHTHAHTHARTRTHTDVHVDNLSLLHLFKGSMSLQRNINQDGLHQPACLSASGPQTPGTLAGFGKHVRTFFTLNRLQRITRDQTVYQI